MSEEIKRPVGRPTKYNDEVQSMAEDYLDTFGDQGDLVPTVVGLALHLDVATNTVYNWATEDNQEFLRIFTRVEQLQHRRLINGGLSGEFNPAITKMMMTKHGYSDKLQTDVTSSDGSMSPKDNSDAVLAALKAKHDTARNS